jgi:hypothetical protein
MIGAARREDIVSALRRGTVPGSGLDALAVGIESFAPTLDAELATVAADTAGAFRGIIDGWYRRCPSGPLREWISSHFKPRSWYTCGQRRPASFRNVASTPSCWAFSSAKSWR